MGDQLTAISQDERPPALRTLSSAFADDPVVRWLWPDDTEYAEVFPRFADAFGGRAFDEGTAWRLGDLSAVALWLAPGVVADDGPIVEVMAGSVAQQKHDDMFATLEQLGDRHPSYPHWYLPWLGVDAAHQGQGLGSRLMTPCLERVDADHLPAYLETPNPRTLPFYARHGFDVVGTAQAGACPPLWLMSRAAR
ncbi:GNAT family N-acetyltransferase [Acidothermaceae bacterium B102]|nr:GNAT family N-acetyltransferase [Acidothermaceae bacterium B102]